ncbi:MAG TPA: 5'-nucleotidase C-terminal domain-containing protein [Kofleriaceae bacterium]|nr:5'-nucleotidase C-terminal domain-containing protein [Kofleriaceae bacterium]
MRPLPFVVAVLVACSGGGGSGPDPSGPAAGGRGPGRDAAPEAARPVTIAVVGTSDLHGHIEMLPILAGYLANLRAAKGIDEVLLLDGGDMFQGTLESNLNEGQSVVEAYNRLGYAAAAIGNHEFDFGPAGDKVTPREPGDDPRGALKARAAAAKFPFLAANLRDEATGDRAAWPNVRPSVLVERAGVKIGVIGVTTEATPRATTPRNFEGLSIMPLTRSIAAEAAALRARGAQVVALAAHAGGRCTAFADARDLASCDPEQEIFQVARELPPGAVDVIVGGHTHAAVAHEVAGIPIVQSHWKGIAFGRVDITLDEERRVVERRIHEPRYLCEKRESDADPCVAGEYEGAPVVPDAELGKLVARYEEEAREVRHRKIGVTLEGKVARGYDHESPLGNLIADLMLAARPKGDVAITNGGGIRAELPGGELTYGSLYEALPFDNKFAVVELTGAQLRTVLAANLARDNGILSIAGVRVAARCEGKELDITLTRSAGKRKGKRVGDKERVAVVTSDFVASGGDGILAVVDVPATAIQIDQDGETIRDLIAGVLTARGGRLQPGTLHDPKAPRVAYPGERPVACH